MSRQSSRSRTTLLAADLLHRTLVDSAGSYRRCKVILDGELKRISTQLNRTDLVPAQRAEYLMQLLEVQRVLGQDMRSIGQLVTAKPTPGGAESSGSDVLSEAEIMSQLVDGKKRR